MRLRGAFEGCHWCGGTGCMGCDEERQKARERASRPIFTADRNDPEDMRQLAEVFGGESLNSAFGPGGGGMREIEEKAALASLAQCLRKSNVSPKDSRTEVES